MAEGSQNETLSIRQRLAMLFTEERRHTLYTILFSACLTAGAVAWNLGWLDFSRPYSGTTQKPPAAGQGRHVIALPVNWHTEDVVLHLDIPSGWKSQITPYHFTDDWHFDIHGTAQFSPPGTPNSDPTGLTVSHIFPHHNDAHYFPLPGIADDLGFDPHLHSHEDMHLLDHHLLDVSNPMRSVAPFGGREAFAIDYELTSESTSHKCTERQLVVNQVGAIIRLCSPAGAETIPQDYQALLSSARWIPRQETDFAQSTVFAESQADSIAIPLPEGWQVTRTPDGVQDKTIDPPGFSDSSDFPRSHALTIQRIPLSLLSGKWAIYPTHTPPTPCSPKWKTMVDSWSDSAEQYWLEDRTIGGENACGFSSNPNPWDRGRHYWFVPRQDGLWVFTVRIGTPPTPEEKEQQQSGHQEEAHFLPEHTTQAYKALDQTKWTTVANKGTE
ncbi:MAG: hypothetical protein Q4C87_12255 [Actinomycetaceae bacterium]|nr:hypothetical protein [Actinomycetaceae bacterium]